MTISGPNTLVAVGAGGYSSDPRPGGELFSLRIEDGATMQVAGEFRFEYESNVTVSGSGSLLDVTGLFEQQYGTSVIKVENGGTLDSGAVRLASRNGDSTAVVTGAGSGWTSTAFWFGSRPTAGKNGTALVLDGGTVTTGEVRQHDTNPGETYRYLVSGTDSLWTASAFYVAGRGPGQVITNRRDHGLLVVASNGSVESTSMTIFPEGTLSGDGSVTVTNSQLDW